MIFEYIRKLIVILQKENKDKIQQLTGLHLQNLANKNKAINPTTMSGGTMISLARGDIDEISFEHELENLKQKKMKQQQLPRLCNFLGPKASKYLLSGELFKTGRG